MTREGYVESRQVRAECCQVEMADFWPESGEICMVLFNAFIKNRPAQGGADLNNTNILSVLLYRFVEV